jgi:hypothetical protein
MTTAVLRDVVRTASGHRTPGGTLSAVQPADLPQRRCVPWATATDWIRPSRTTSSPAAWGRHRTRPCASPEPRGWWPAIR